MMALKYVADWEFHKELCAFLDQENVVVHQSFREPPVGAQMEGFEGPSRELRYAYQLFFWAKAPRERYENIDRFIPLTVTRFNPMHIYAFKSLISKNPSKRLHLFTSRP